MYRTEKRWIVSTVVLAAAITGTFAVAQNLTVRGVTTGEGDALFLSNVQVSGKLTASNTGSVAVRWGNGTAPPGTTLIHTGFSWGPHYSHHGAGDPICVQPGDPGGSITGTPGELLYPSKTTSQVYVPPGIAPLTNLKCAVFHAPGALFELWGSATCPTGWTALYSGVAMGQHYANAGGKRRHCVDNVEYDGSVPYNGISGDNWHVTKLHGAVDPGMTGYQQNTYLKCAMCMKE